MPTAIPEPVEKHTCGHVCIRFAPDCGPHSHCLTVNSNVAHPFETKLFKGRMSIWIKNVESNPLADCFFKGKKRQVYVAVQGQVKEPLMLDSIQTGQLFSHPLQKIPQRHLLKMGLGVIQRIAPQLNANLLCDSPYMLAPLASAAMQIHEMPVELLNQEKNEENNKKIFNNIDYSDCLSFRKDEKINNCLFKGLSPISDVPEYAPGLVNLRDKDGKQVVLSAHDRKTYFKKWSNLENKSLIPGIIYTFTFYTDMLNIDDYKLKIGILGKIDISNHLLNQPIEIMAIKCDKNISNTPPFDKDNNISDKCTNTPPFDMKSDNYLWRLQLCHKKCFPTDK
eukprot:GHVL01002897.1.p1 GENE.GHVL01002897.1~~GHVL01002897.1.p1  ORF type:complete len:348 (+),score=74.39 GHVL01002897.1:35-1045(+)